MKYKVGDEFIVKIKEIMDSDNGTLYRSNFNTLVFDEYGLDKLQKLEDTDFLEGLKTGLTGLSCKSKEAYEKGLADAWELARKVSHMCLDDMNKCFDLEDLDKYGADKMLYEHFTPQEALAKIEAYEESKVVKVGDVVSIDIDIKGVVLDDDGLDCYIVLDENNCVEARRKDSCKKTGRHIDIEHLLEQIRGNE